jgi:tRNA(Glu) U13 pseudouridine synthase TruD
MNLGLFSKNQKKEGIYHTKAIKLTKRKGNEFKAQLKNVAQLFEEQFVRLNYCTDCSIEGMNIITCWLAM